MSSQPPATIANTNTSIRPTNTSTLEAQAQNPPPLIHSTPYPKPKLQSPSTRADRRPQKRESRDGICRFRINAKSFFNLRRWRCTRLQRSSAESSARGYGAWIKDDSAANPFCESKLHVPNQRGSSGVLHKQIARLVNFLLCFVRGVASPVARFRRNDRNVFAANLFWNMLESLRGSLDKDSF